MYQRICSVERELFDFNHLVPKNLPLWNRRKQIQREILGTDEALTADYVQREINRTRINQ